MILRKAFRDRDNDTIEAASKMQKLIKIPVGQDKLHEVDIAQREYYPGISCLIKLQYIGLVLYTRSGVKYGL